MWVKRILYGILGLIILFVVASAAFFMVGPISNPKVLFNALLGTGIPTPLAEALSNHMQLPEGFTLGVYARDIPHMRFIELSAAGDLLVAQPRDGRILLLVRDDNADGAADGQRVLIDQLARPHAIDFYQDWLYIAESDAIGRIRYDAEQGKTLGEYQRIIELNDWGMHWTKTLRFGPDEKLYVTAGSTCNVCEQKDTRRAVMLRYNPDGSGEEIYATGLRNSVGFDWSPVDGGLYATDNGRDFMGDDIPPCELNRIVQGGFYGWPNVHGFGLLDPRYGSEDALESALSPVLGFAAHNAPLGIRFIEQPSWPSEYQGAALVALHGSWNRSEPDGYKVVSVHKDTQSTPAQYSQRDFLSGFVHEGQVMGRPVDIAQDTSGCVYISDDYGAAIYRICYQQAQNTLHSAVKAASLTSGLEALSEPRRQAMHMQGEKIFKQKNCGSCHALTVAKQTESKPKGKISLNALKGRYSLDTLANFFNAPTPPMPKISLSKAERNELAVYLLSQQ